MNIVEIALDGHRLSDVDSAIVVTDVRQASDTVLRTADRPAGHGSRFAGLRRRALTVTACFEVHMADPARRQAILDRVNEWCGGHMLTLSCMPGKRLRVRCTARPRTSALRWTDTLTAEFTACETPFWEAEQASSAGASGREAALTLCLPGSAETVAEAVIVNPEGSACDTLCLSAGGAQLAFAHLGLGPGEQLQIGHDWSQRMVLRIEGPAGSRLVYDRRTAGSADELILAPGRNEVRCTADKALDWRVTARGRWL